MPNLPAKHWPPRDWRSVLALLFSVLGAVALTFLVWSKLDLLMPDRGWTIASEATRIATIKWVLWIATTFIGIVLVGLGMAINRRALRLRSGDKSAEFEGGEDEAPDFSGAPQSPEPDTPAR